MLSVLEIKNILNAELQGNPEIVITNISSLEKPKESSIVFCRSLKEKKLLNKSIGAVVVSKKLIKQFKGFNVLGVDSVKISLAILSKYFKPKNTTPIIINVDKYNNLVAGENCCAGKNVSIGLNCEFGHNIVIGDNVIIGNNVKVMNNVTIFDNTLIGHNSIIGPSSSIGYEGFGNVFDDNHGWLHIEHLGSVEIGNNVSIGANCCIDRGTLENTIIQDGVIIDNLVHIAHNVVVGSDTAIAAKVGIAGSCHIGKRNKIGGMVGIVDHVNTCDDVTISATSTIISDITEPGTYTGIMPSVKHSLWKRIALHIKKIDKIT